MPAPNFTYMFAICGPRTCHAAMLSSCLYHCIPHGYQFQVLAADAPGKDVAHGPRAWVRVTHVGDSTKPLAPAWPSSAAEAPESRPGDGQTFLHLPLFANLSFK